MNWHKIKHNPNYSINEKGEIRNDLTGNVKAPFINKKTGYLTVDLWSDNKSKKFAVHRLLAESFLPNPDNKPTVDHADGNRLNNSLDNLRWASYNEQNSRFETIGVRSEKVRVTHYEEIRKKRGGGHEAWGRVDRTLYFDRIKDVAEYFGVTSGNISSMLQKGTIGMRGKMRGYMFEYVDGERITFS